MIVRKQGNWDCANHRIRQLSLDDQCCLDYHSLLISVLAKDVLKFCLSSGENRQWPIGPVSTKNLNGLVKVYVYWPRKSTKYSDIIDIVSMTSSSHFFYIRL